jgi:regulation of enolase protein 1 (concanavalin A-like superfamily)
MSRQRLLLAVGSLFVLLPFVRATDEAGPDPGVVEPFNGKLRLRWTIVRPDDKHWSLTKNKGKLTITTQRGSIHGETPKNDLARNLFLLENPYTRNADFAVSVCVADFKPSANYNQGGLLLYDDDDNYVKFTCEYSSVKKDKRILVMMRETAARPEHKLADLPGGATKIWLRLTKRKSKYEYASSADGKKWTVHHAWEWGTKGPARIGILAKNGGTNAPEIDVTFEDFRARSILAKDK